MKLTTREREVIELVGDGESTRTIAQRLGISPWTVKEYLKIAMQRNGWHTRAQAAVCLRDEA